MAAFKSSKTAIVAKPVIKCEDFIKNFDEKAKELGLEMPNIDMTDDEIASLKPLFDHFLQVDTSDGKETELRPNKDMNTYWTKKVRYSYGSNGTHQVFTPLNLVSFDEYVAGNVLPPKAGASLWNELIKSEEYAHLKSCPPPPESAKIDSALMLSVREYRLKRGESSEGKPRSPLFQVNEILACYQRY